MLCNTKLEQIQSLSLYWEECSTKPGYRAREKREKGGIDRGREREKERKR